MEMVIPQTVSPQAGAGAQTLTQAAGQIQNANGSGGASFQKALVQQIGGGSQQAAEASKPVVQLVGLTTAAAADDSAVLPLVTDLMSLIDGLLEQLSDQAETEATQASDEEASSELLAALDQMNALLSMIGAPIVLAARQTAPIGGVEDQADGLESAPTIAQLKSNLADTLLQLQALLAQGNLKQVQQQEPTVLIHQQLQALSALLQGEQHGLQPKQEAKQGADASQWFSTVPTAKTETGALLQRLSQQAVHPSYVAAAAALASEATEPASEQTVEQMPLVQVTAGNAEQAKNAAPLVSKAAPVHYVLADQFAETMTGLVVQKLEVTTIGAVSEAKLMLFPEQLGQVDVRISVQNGQLTAIFQTDTAMAKDILDNQLSQLRIALQSQGIVVDKLEVSQGQSSSQLFGQHSSQGNGQQASQNRQSSKGEGNVEASFESEIVEQATIQGLGYGRAINVKA